VGTFTPYLLVVGAHGHALDRCMRQALTRETGKPPQSGDGRRVQRGRVHKIAKGRCAK